MLILKPGAVSLSDLQSVVVGSSAVQLDPAVRDAVEQGAKIIQAAVDKGQPVYGVNTGFGKLANIAIDAGDTETLQRNLILSHCCGVGAKASPQVTRLLMVLKLLSLGRGASGVRWELLQLLEALIAHDILPVIPEQGSVGASGDLAPLAHLAAALIGEGEVSYRGRIVPAREALASEKLQPVKLAAKEGLALINGTQFSTANALVALFYAWNNLQTAVVVSALSTDAIMGSTQPLLAQISELRGHRGQIQVAHAMRALLEGSEIRESHREDDTRVQDPYCIRCQPQVTGACLDLLRFSAHALLVEANAVTDNPLVLRDSGSIVSGGNFHAQPVAFAADQIALAIAETGSIAQRRVALMVDPSLSYDLPPFLTRNPGLNSGFMVAEITTAALMSENKHLANPCSTDSTPTSANQEDHVSMAAHGACRLARMNRNLVGIIAVELMCSAQGVEFRSPLNTSTALQAVIHALRERVPALGDDRYMADDLAIVSELINRGVFLMAARSTVEFELALA